MTDYSTWTDAQLQQTLGDLRNGAKLLPAGDPTLTEYNRMIAELEAELAKRNVKYFFIMGGVVFVIAMLTFKIKFK